MRNSLILWDPFKELLDTGDVFDRFFARNLKPASSLWGLPGKKYDVPAIDVYDKKDRLVAKVEVPGLGKEDLKVSVDGDVLTVTGERKKEDEIKEKDYYCSERVYGSFSRSIPLPVSVDKDRVKASYKKGVLTVELPKSKEAVSKEIEVDIQ